MLRLATLAAMLLVALPAPAAEPYCDTGKPHPIDVAEAKRAQTATTTVDMRAAQSDAYQAWDKELNRVYAELLRGLAADKASASKLRKAQRAWLAYRDGEIEWLWSKAMYGSSGTAGPLNVSGAGTQMVRQRTCELQRSLQARDVLGD
jgi:uncharacterized protein YecT (DUF1311 family)